MGNELNPQDYKQFKGNDTRAFGKHYLKINLIKTEDEGEVSRVDFVVGCITKTFKNPKFPLIVDFSSEETQHLNFNNIGYLVAYDTQGRPEQCQGFIKFTFYNGVIRAC